MKTGSLVKVEELQKAVPRVGLHTEEFGTVMLHHMAAILHHDY